MFEIIGFSLWELSFNALNDFSYEMTPVAKKVYKSSNFENYDIGDLNSEDSTDEEDKPRKRIPTWAEGIIYQLLISVN